MTLDENWQLISRDGAIIQNGRSGIVSLCYAEQTPTVEEKFSLLEGIIREMPKVSGKGLYARVVSGTTIITVEETSKYQVAMNVADEANFLGEMYYTRAKFSSVATSNEVKIAITVGSEKNLFIVDRSFSVTTDRMELEVYSMPSFTGGTAMSVLPYNSITPVLPAKVSAWLEPTVTDDGVLFDEFLMLGDPSNNANNVAGSFRSNDVFRMIPAGSTFLIKFKNEGTVPMDGIVKYLFFERDIDIPLN